MLVVTCDKIKVDQLTPITKVMSTKIDVKYLTVEKSANIVELQLVFRIFTCLTGNFPTLCC